MKNIIEIKEDLKPFTETNGYILPVKIWISENDFIECVEIDELSFSIQEVRRFKKYLKYNGFKLFEDGKNFLRKK